MIATRSGFSDVPGAEAMAPESSTKRSSGALNGLLQLTGAGAGQHVPDHPLHGAADQRAQDPAEVGLDPVRRPRAVSTQVLELPASVDRLQVTLLLGPAQPGGATVVVEANDRLDRSDLNVRRDLAANRATL